MRKQERKHTGGDPARGRALGRYPGNTAHYGEKGNGNSEEFVDTQIRARILLQ